MGLFGVDANKVQQTSISAQATSQEGAAFGAVTGRGSVGAASQGNILGGIKAGEGSTVNITTPDAAAIAAVTDIANANTALSLETLKSQQELSTLAVSYAGINANTALQTLQQLQTQSQVGAAGGSASDIAGIAGAYTGETTTPATNKTWLYVSIAVAAIAGIILYVKNR
jgi:hypothetical protein